MSPNDVVPTYFDENIFINAPVSIVNIKNFLEKRSPVLFQSNVSSQKIKETFDSFELNNSFFKLFSEDFSTASFTLSLPEMTTSELEQVITDIKRDFKASFNTNKYALNINGFAVVFAQLNNFILETQFKSFVAAFFVAFLCLWVSIKNFRNSINLDTKILSFTFLQFILVVVSFLCLILSFVFSDFSNETVFNNSHTTKPLFYKISGTWGNHEGSLLLWLLVLTLFIFFFKI